MRSRPSRSSTPCQGARHLLDVLAATVGQGQVGGVEDRQQLLDQGAGGPLEMVGLLLDHALLVVLEVGLQADERVAVVVALAR